MFPSRLKKESRIITLTLIITAISGANFFSILMFWPTQAYNMYGHDPVGKLHLHAISSIRIRKAIWNYYLLTLNAPGVGVRVLPVGFAILGGAVIVLVLLSVLGGHIRELLGVACIFMTAGCGALAVADLNNLHQVYGILVIAGLGIGGIVVPAAIIITIICPDDLIATVTALTLSIRVIGGCVGYTTYYNVFVHQFGKNAVKYIGGAMVEIGATNSSDIAAAIGITGVSLLEELRTIPAIGNNETAYNMIVYAGQLAYSESYKYVYYISLAFGALSLVCAALLGDIGKYMNNHVAVQM
jgi:hypothetical protein